MSTPNLRIKCRAIAGHGYGLRQQIITGQISLASTAASRLNQAVALLINLADSTLSSCSHSNTALPSGIDCVLFLYLKLQQQAKIPVFDEGVVLLRNKNLGSTPGAAESSSYTIILPYWNIKASKIVLAWIADTSNKTESNPSHIQDLIGQLKPYALNGTNAYRFAQAAWELNLPFSHVYDRILQFGLGRQSRWLDSSLSDAASAISTSLCKKKHATNYVLRRLGFPVTRQIVVTTLEAALSARNLLSPPLVTKPIEQDQGRGVSVALSTAEQLKDGFEAAASFGKGVIVEEYVSGYDYRLTVLHDTVVKVIKRQPLSVFGDGCSTIMQLLKNKNSLRSNTQKILHPEKNPFAVDQEISRALAEQGLDLSTVIPIGKQIILRKIANISTGGSQELIPVSEVHRDNQLLAVEATKALRLDLCGIDLITSDISRSWRDVGCRIIELNAQPQIGISTAPETYNLIMKRLIQEEPPRMMIVIPPAANNTITPEDKVIQRFLQGKSHPLVVASSRQLWHEEVLALETETEGPELIKRALQDRRAATILFILNIQHILQYGLPTNQLECIYLAAENSSDPRYKRQLLELRQLAAAIPLQTFTWSETG